MLLLILIFLVVGLTFSIISFCRPVEKTRWKWMNFFYGRDRENICDAIVTYVIASFFACAVLLLFLSGGFDAQDYNGRLTELRNENEKIELILEEAPDEGVSRMMETLSSDEMMELVFEGVASREDAGNALTTVMLSERMESNNHEISRMEDNLRNQSAHAWAISFGLWM